MVDLVYIPKDFLDFLSHFPKYLSPGVSWLLVTFVISYAFQTLKDFVLTGGYKTASIGMLMFQPYPRIFITTVCGYFRWICTDAWCRKHVYPDICIDKNLL